MHYRAAAHVVHVTAARDDGPADHDQDDRGQDDKGPRRRSTGAGKGAASADAPAALLFAAVAVLACCAAVLSKHRQYQGAQQYYQARLAAEHAAAEALQLEQQQLQVLGPVGMAASGRERVNACGLMHLGRLPCTAMAPNHMPRHAHRTVHGCKGRMGPCAMGHAPCGPHGFELLVTLQLQPSAACVLGPSS